MTLFTRSMTLTHCEPAGLDADGRPVVSATSSTVYGGYRHRQAVDRLDAGLVVVDEWTVYLPAGTVVSVGDGVDVDGGAYEVVSVPFPQWNHRLARVDHLEVQLKRVERAPRPVSTLPVVVS